MFTTLPAHPLPSSPHAPPLSKTEKGFFVKIHLLECLKLVLYGVFFKSYSLMIIIFLECGSM